LRGVAFLTESFHPVLGGGEQHIRALAARLVARGLPCLVVTRRTSMSWPRRESIDGIEVVRVGPSGEGRTGKYLMIPGALRVLRAERKRFDPLVVRGTRVLGLPGLLLGRWLGKGVIVQPELNGELSGMVYTWGTPLDRPVFRGAVSRLVKLRNNLLKDADAFVAMSRQIRDEFLLAGVRAEKVAYIPHGVDCARFRPAKADERRMLRRGLGIPETARVIVYTGRLLRGKGLLRLLEAFGQLQAKYENAHLMLVGSGVGQSLSVESELRARALKSGLEAHVTFTGRVERVEDCLRAADIFAFPSVFEGLGLSLIEASACGLPCVGSRTGGIVDVIEEGGSGFLVAPGESAGLAEALGALLRDGDVRERFGRRARDLAQARFDLEDSVDLYRALFEEVHTRRIPAPPSFAREEPEGGASRAL